MSDGMQLAIISGLSGAGKTVALRQYEDLGYYCIDNMPIDFVQPLIAHVVGTKETRYRKLGVGIDARANPRDIAEFPRYFDSVRGLDIDASVVFLTASDDVLLRRYHETRRKHPLSGENTSLLEAIRAERRLLEPIANLADLELDTSHMNLHELRLELLRRINASSAGKLEVLFLSFGYKNGVPEGADFVFDARCLANPHWVPELRALTGLDGAVAAYLEQRAETGEWLEDVRAYLTRWLPRFQAQDRTYVTVALGCTGGQHRSVYLAERLAADFRRHFDAVTVKHRELAR
jgi:UPF0042 nucleotide-binding protein